MKKLFPLCVFCLLSFLIAEESRWQVTLEGGPVWFSRNDVAVPGDSGTKFNLLFDLIGAAAPQGRAFDAALLLRWQGEGDWFGAAGVRSIEGGGGQ